MKILSENVLKQNIIDFNNNGGKTMYTYKFLKEDVKLNEEKEEKVENNLEKQKLQLNLLEKRKNNALECFDISYALKIQSEINELESQIKKEESLLEENSQKQIDKDDDIENKIKETISLKAK